MGIPPRYEMFMSNARKEGAVADLSSRGSEFERACNVRTWYQEAARKLMKGKGGGKPPSAMVSCYMSVIGQVIRAQSQELELK